jgi:hypothetical protein
VRGPCASSATFSGSARPARAPRHIARLSVIPEATRGHQWIKGRKESRSSCDRRASGAFGRLPRHDKRGPPRPALGSLADTRRTNKRGSWSRFREFLGAATTRGSAGRDVDIAAVVTAAAESKSRIAGSSSPHKTNYLPHAKMKGTPAGCLDHEPQTSPPRTTGAARSAVGRSGQQIRWSPTTRTKPGVCAAGIHGSENTAEGALRRSGVLTATPDLGRLLKWARRLHALMLRGRRPPRRS